MKTVYLIPVVLFLFTHAASALVIETGSIEGAPYKIVRAEEANGPLLLLAHGLRPESVPVTAEFDHGNDIMQGLLDAGWTIGSTGYRRNGWIFEDAMEDLLNLKKRVGELWEAPSETYLLGGSMGGLIITMLAEQHGESLSGAVAMGAALRAGEGNWRKPFTFSPQMPVLYLTNQSEINGPREYVEKAADAPHPPALWEVKRDGHVNLNVKEQAAALEAVVKWARTGEIDRSMDGTIEPDAQSVATFEDGSAEAPVVRIHPIYGNITSAFIAQDLSALGIEPGQRFRLSYKDHSVSILFGTTYGDVPRGDWVGFLDADGKLLIVRNFADAAGTLGANVGARLSISRME